MFVAETKEEIENNGRIFYDSIEEFEYVEVYAGVIYTDHAECVAAKNEVISKRRESLYVELVDPLHAERQKNTILGEWTDQDEEEYVAKVKAYTKKIREENPYISEA